MQKSTVFVDRDGVINVNRANHVRSWSDFEFLPNALAGLAYLTRHDFDVYVITNQAIVNRGVISQAQLNALHARMLATVETAGGRVRALYSCPHRPDEGCLCRKPEPGMLTSAAADHAIRLGEALLIGDHADDLEAARRAGCPSILVLSGRTANWSAASLPPGCLSVQPDLLAAARFAVAWTGRAAVVARP